MSLELTFPASASGDASVLARELRMELAEGGVPVQAIALKRSDPDNMDLGSLLHLSGEIFLTAHVTYAMAKIILNFARRTRNVIKIRDTNGDFDISTDTVDLAGLSKLLAKISEARHGPQP